MINVIKKQRKINKQSGAAMLITVVFFLFISLAIIAGLVSPAVREFRNANVNFSSKESYFLAESGVEDVAYRTINNLTVSNNETLTLNGNSATTTTTTLAGNSQQITSLGDVLNYQRKVGLVLKTGSGTVFKYGTQAGQGGVTFQENTGLYGSLYSNGNIIGHSNAFITGDAFVANAPALTADQTNGIDTPSNNITFGNATATQDFAQSFQLTNDGLVNKAQFYIKKVGSPANATVRITTDTSSHPNTTNVTTGTLNANFITTNYGWVDVAFSTNPQMIHGVTYWLGIDGGNDSSNYYIIGGDNAYTNGQGKIGRYGSTWNNTNPVGLDGYFSIFLGGATGKIDNMLIGRDKEGNVSNPPGNAYAHTLTRNTITGNAYCKVDNSSNNKVCDTSKDDPVQVSLPISDANIAEWKADAYNDGVGELNGNQSISGSSHLGPVKINGNLTVSGTLTLDNTVWVTGNVSITGTVQLAPSFLATTGIIIADGYIDVGNNSKFYDSGTAGSYIMLLSTSSCDSAVVGNPCGDHDAITASNNSNLIIANAQKGAVNFNNNAGVKEVVANRIYLSNNAYVTYGTGLLSVDFTSGPSGGWAIDSWTETQ